MMNKFSAGIHVLVKRNNKYLLIRRSEIDREDPCGWDLPGGGIDFGEQPFEAALRETKEETGLTVKVTEIINLWAMSYDNFWSIESLVAADYVSGTVQLSPEHSEYKWVTLDELEKITPRSVHLKALNNRQLS